MKLYIKNMVCNRCKMVVKAELEKLGLHPVSVELGSVELENELDEAALDNINAALTEVGFALIDDRKSQLIEKVKNIIVELVHARNSELKTNLSDYITKQIPHSYNYISSLFTEVEGTTIEQYFIAQKIERVKELLVYGELTLSEIAFQSGYSSVAHLSGQFKKVTGLNPSHFKGIKDVKRKPLDQL
jgi:AraC-like DNA-binding protein